MIVVAPGCERRIYLVYIFWRMPPMQSVGAMPRSFRNFMYDCSQLQSYSVLRASQATLVLQRLFKIRGIYRTFAGGDNSLT